MVLTCCELRNGELECELFQRGGVCLACYPAYFWEACHWVGYFFPDWVGLFHPECDGLGRLGLGVQQIWAASSLGDSF